MPRRPPEPHVGHRVRQLRLGSGMTQEQLAERSHVAPETISRIERGKLVPAVDVLVGIASVLEVTLDELVLTTKPLKKRTTGLRPAVQRIVALVEPLSDAEIDDVRESLMAILRVGGRHPPRR